MTHKRHQGNRQKVKGAYLALPKTVIESPDFYQLSGLAVKLLIQIAQALNGRNNGDLSAGFNDMKRRGWNSKSTLAAKLKELIDAGFLVKTRQGYFQNPGSRCDLYAVTWLAIDECVGKDLDIPATRAPYRSFAVEGKKMPSPHKGLSSPPREGRCRTRDIRGRFTSTRDEGRLTDTAESKKWTPL